MQETDFCGAVSEEDLRHLARKWLSELRGNLPPGESESGQLVVSMNFSASPETQWRFVLIAVSLSESDDELSHIAAGPIEHLLGWHGDGYIGIVENESRTNPQFARALTGVWQYMMPDDIWSRVQVLQRQVPEPLRASDSDDTEQIGYESRSQAQRSPVPPKS